MDCWEMQLEEPFSANHTEKRAFIFVQQQIQAMCFSEHVNLYCNHNQIKNQLGEENWPHVSKVVDSAVFHRESRYALLMEGTHLRHYQNHTQNTHTLCIRE